MDCQLVTSGNPVNLKDKFSVRLKTLCMVFLILWSMVSRAFPLGESLFLSPMSERLKGDLG